MRPVLNEKFGENDPDIATMFAEALMMLAPWKLWTVPWPTRRQSSHS
jgi:hypothetical protein